LLTGGVSCEELDGRTSGRGDGEGGREGVCSGGAFDGNAFDVLRGELDHDRAATADDENLEALRDVGDGVGGVVSVLGPDERAFDDCDKKERRKLVFVRYEGERERRTHSTSRRPSQDRTGAFPSRRRTVQEAHSPLTPLLPATKSGRGAADPGS
jgi:hypothetical protein